MLSADDIIVDQSSLSQYQIDNCVRFDEFDFNDITVGKGKGFLNAGLRWNVAENLLIEVNFKDINLDKDDFVNREVKIMYSEKF